MQSHQRTLMLPAFVDPLMNSHRLPLPTLVHLI